MTFFFQNATVKPNVCKMWDVGHDVAAVVRCLCVHVCVFSVAVASLTRL